MIKQIWFDFGNVFIPVFPDRAHDEFENREVQLTYKEIKFLNHSLETGKLDDLEFFKTIASSCKYLKSQKAIENGWNELLGELSDHILFLKKLKKEYKLCLVSNTNATHINAIRKNAGPYLWNNFIKQFKSLLLSFEIGQRKPDETYFKYALELMNVKPNTVLFIDDSDENIEAAAKLGIKTFKFNIQEGDLEEELPAILTKFN